MSKVSRDEQTIEGIVRLKKLEVLDNVINDFKEGRINKSEFGGILYWLDDEERAFVSDWEKDTGNLVYHVIKNETDMGTCYSFLYVSKYKEEWGMDRDDLEDLGSEGYLCPVVYVYFKNGTGYNEYGRIGIKPNVGGVMRIY